MLAAAIEVRNLNKRYRNGTWANRDITLTVERGELLAILGPNGAGKTTLVRQITTELAPPCRPEISLLECYRSY